MAITALPTIQDRLRRTSKRQRTGIALLILVVLAFAVAFFAFEKQIFQILEPAVDYIRKSSAGIIVLAAIMGATCIFPLFGYGVVSMVCGYVYGIPKGFIPAFFGDIVGASVCFWLYRFAFHKYFSRKFNDNLEFKEMSKAVSKDGISILFLIRLSSFPFAVLNAYFGSMTQLPYWKFILATTLSTPRLFISIFIGHNISSLTDPDITGKDRILKWAGNILGIVIALAVAWYIYRHTTRRIQRINAGLAAEDDEEEDEVEARARAMHQQQQQHQYSLPPYDSSTDLTNEGQWSEHRRNSTYDTAVRMEELESLQRRGSGEGQGAETIAVVKHSLTGYTV